MKLKYFLQVQNIFCIHKVVWCNLLLYILLYSALSVTYRYLLSDEQKVTQIFVN